MDKDTKAWVITLLVIILFCLLVCLVATYPIVQLVFSLVSGVILVAGMLFMLKEIIKRII